VQDPRVADAVGSAASRRPARRFAQQPVEGAADTLPPRGTHRALRNQRRRVAGMWRRGDPTRSSSSRRVARISSCATIGCISASFR